MAESGYSLAGLGMGKVKSINQYRLTPGFGGFTPVSHVTTACRLTCASAHYLPCAGHAQQLLSSLMVAKD
ncbi:TPA: hypothetical protein J8125_004683 [Escherichia coli]|uniref:hypothetical protein n=1 Tax=Escherichia coli TaxID=562 RepID=UPI000BE4DCAF|nr:hypothetical protein [Escherichia coli]EFN2533226.1 hypothetical protein [Escherichia coli]EHT2943711.1 hypothetical protein [Escherichia coli]EJD5586819.1 hypothetical protein [Escherichia coli]EJK9248838.1 hypothetical protein [Escherichia coli]EJV1935142.1 hypothetical protein [Escherichia coli]